MRTQILLLFFLNIFIFNKSFSQENIDPQLLLGTWRIDLMQDSSGYAIDFVRDPDSTEDGIFSYFTFKPKKVLLE